MSDELSSFLQTMLHDSAPSRRISDDHIDNLVELSHYRAQRLLVRPARPSTPEASPRCPVCNGFMSQTPSRFVDGVEYHRSCLGDDAA